MKKRNCKKIVEKFLNRQKGKSTHATPKEVNAYEWLCKYKPNSWLTYIVHETINTMKSNEKIWVMHIGNHYSYWITRYHIPIRRANLSEVLEYCKNNGFDVMTRKPKRE